jgi:hypothetical protein
MFGIHQPWITEVWGIEDVPEQVAMVSAMVGWDEGSSARHSVLLILSLRE